MAAVSTQNVVVWTELTADTDGNSFFTAIQMKGANHIAKIGLSICFFFELTNSPHSGVHFFADVGREAHVISP